MKIHTLKLSAELTVLTPLDRDLILYIITNKIDTKRKNTVHASKIQLYNKALRDMTQF